MNNFVIGRSGEDKAEKYLKKQKYKILERNFSCTLGEIDIIAQDGEFLVFVEVKARSSTAFGKPGEAVDEFKQMKIIKTALYYQKIKRKFDMPVRFDVVEVLDNDINLIKSAFDAF